VAPDGGCEVVVCRDDADAVEGGIVASHVFFRKAGDALPGDRVTLAGKGGAPDEPKANFGLLTLGGEVYEDVEGAGGAFAVAGQVV
jgi:hypothetical protein